MISPLVHWRVAGATAALLLAGSSAMFVAMHDRPAGSVAYESWPAPSVRPTPAARVAAAAHTSSGREGLQLMMRAVNACRTSAFTGVEVARWWGPAGIREWLARIWHRPGAAPVALPTAAVDGQPALPAGASTVITVQQLDLLQLGYMLFYSGQAIVGGRRAELVAIDRPDGSLAAKYWLDAETGLPLRRELFDAHAHLMSDVSIIGLRTGPLAAQGMPPGTTPAAAPAVGPQAMSALRAKGWPLPDELPGGMVLLDATKVALPTGPVIALSYSDGLSAISLFVQRGVLPTVQRGWQRVSVAGHDAYALDRDDQTIVWAGDGYVFTLIAEAPPATVDRVLSALPHTGEPGFWGRLDRGFRRLVSWANPFR